MRGGSAVTETNSMVKASSTTWISERATQLGWPSDRVQVIDEDLGKSGASAEHRSGFQSLMTEIG